MPCTCEIRAGATRSRIEPTQLTEKLRNAVPTFDSAGVVTVLVAGTWLTRIAGEHVDRSHHRGDRGNALAKA